MIYNAATLHYFRTAERAGVLTSPNTLRGAAGSRAHGTWVQFDVEVEAGMIRAARFLVFGCPHTIAVCGWVAEHAMGQPALLRLPSSVQALSERFVVPEEKRGRLLVVEDAWLAALAQADGEGGEGGVGAG